MHLFNHVPSFFPRPFLMLKGVFADIINPWDVQQPVRSLVHQHLILNFLALPSRLLLLKVLVRDLQIPVSELYPVVVETYINQYLFHPSVVVFMFSVNAEESLSSVILCSIEIQKFCDL